MVDQITVTAAGTAAGTAVDLARLGVEVACIGAVGNDELGTFLLLMMMRDRGIDVLGVQRTDRAQTSATVLPIRPNGDRPALHVVGANAHRNRDGVLTLLPSVDWLLPNDAQLRSLFELDDPIEAGRAALDAGAGGVVVSLGADGCVVVTPDEEQHVPANEVDVIDTTGCGDALCAGFIAGLVDGRSPVEAARRGSALASIVAGRLGSDPGSVDEANLLGEHF